MSSAIFSSKEVTDRSDLYQQLNKMAHSSKSLYRMYGSADWLSSIGAFEKDVGVLFFNTNDTSSELALPFKKGIKKVQILNSRILNLKTKLICADAISCEPFGILNDGSIGDMINVLFKNFNDVSGIYIKSIDPGAETFRAIKNSARTITSKYFCCLESPPREFHSLELKDSFDEYLAKFSRKERYNLKRQCRLAKEKCNGELELKRIASTEDIDFFVKSSRVILSKSWKTDLGEIDQLFSEKCLLKYSAISEKGLLRSYVLLGNNEPLAFVLGYQWDGVFHYSNIAYDNERSDLSPGTVMFYLMLEDLFLYNKPMVLNFGIGSSFYKSRFGNDKSTDCSLLILRKNLSNIVLAVCVNMVNRIKVALKRNQYLGK